MDNNALKFLEKIVELSKDNTLQWYRHPQMSDLFYCDESAHAKGFQIAINSVLGSKGNPEYTLTIAEYPINNPNKFKILFNLKAKGNYGYNKDVPEYFVLSLYNLAEASADAYFVKQLGDLNLAFSPIKTNKLELVKG